MSEAIVYCDSCGKMVLPSELQSGAALISAEGSVCSACLESLSPEARAAYTRQSRRTKTPRPDRPPAPHGTSRRSPVPKGDLRRKQILMTGIGMAAGILLGVVIVAVAISSRKDERPAEWTPPAIAVPVFRQTTPAPLPERPLQATDGNAPPDAASAEAVGEDVTERVNEIKGMVTPGMERYEMITSALEQLVKEHPEGAGTAEARQLLEQVKGEFRAIADAELAKTVATARKLAGDGKYSTARSILRSLRPRYGDTDWYSEIGAARIEAVGKEIEDEKERINSAAAAAVAGATPLFVVGFDRDEIGEVPASAPAEIGAVSTRPTHVTSDADESAVVRDSLGGHTSRAAKLVCLNTGSGRPSLDFRLPEPIKSGLIIVSWDSSMLDFTFKTNVETVLTFRMLDGQGVPYFGVTYVHDSMEAGKGVIGFDWGSREIAWGPDAQQHRKWSIGGPIDRFQVTLDPAKGTATVKRNDQVLCLNTAMHPERCANGFGGLNITDGYAAGGVGGGFVAGVSNIRIAHSE